MADKRVQRDLDALSARIQDMSRDVAGEMIRTTCQLASAAIAAAVAVGASTDVTVDWPQDFPTDAYRVDVVPLGLTGRASAAVIDQSAQNVTVRITAGLLVSAGTLFLVHGRS